MRRLKLDLDQISVDTFQTHPAAQDRGTVRAHAITAPGNEPSWPEGTCVQTCTEYWTVPDTCNWSCDDRTCLWSCNTGPCNCGGGTNEV